MIICRYEVRASYKEDDNFLSAYNFTFIMRRNALNWAHDLNYMHPLLYGHREVTYYVYDRKLKERVAASPGRTK